MKKAGESLIRFVKITFHFYISEFCPTTPLPSFFSSFFRGSLSLKAIFFSCYSPPPPPPPSPSPNRTSSRISQKLNCPEYLKYLMNIFLCILFKRLFRLEFVCMLPLWRPLVAWPSHLGWAVVHMISACLESNEVKRL